MVQALLTWESVKDQYPDKEMKKHLSVATVRSNLKKIATKLPDHAEMYTQFISGRKRCKKERELEEYDRGCGMIKAWAKDLGIQLPDFTEPGANQQAAQSGPEERKDE